jgi:Flp pilus assembly protein TadD
MAETSPARARELLREAALRQQMALSLCAEDTDVVRTAIVQTRLGAAEALLGDRLAARTALERATALAPRYALGAVWLGYLAHLDGDDDRAAALLRRAVVDLGPPDATVAAVAQLYVEKI